MGFFPRKRLPYFKIDYFIYSRAPFTYRSIRIYCSELEEIKERKCHIKARRTNGITKKYEIAAKAMTVLKQLLLW